METFLLFPVTIINGSLEALCKMYTPLYEFVLVSQRIVIVFHFMPAKVLVLEVFTFIWEMIKTQMQEVE